MHSNTIIGAEFESHRPLRSMLHEATSADTVYSEESGSRLFKIRTADSSGQRSSASVLINRMYATRGYRATPLPDRQLPSRITLTANDHDLTIGTITIGFDSATGLHVDDLFSDETLQLRRQGRKVCEFTKLAMDSAVRSKRVLASLFHVAYIYAHRMMGFDDLLIEVNPRHVRYYHQMLGFEVFGETRLNRRVNAPAVLMRLRFSHAHEQIAKFAGQAEVSASERSLYPLFFAVHEEAAIVGRLRLAHPESVSRYSSGPADTAAHPHRSMH
ncbi:MAG: long-chain N-acyl amino acid synthase [Pseudomonadota bacterium]|nr:long-chain N-acyl amino acid synthase [Pseudomonadota bacterium]